MTERRRSQRTACRLTCQLHRGGESIRARVLDVSEGGVCVLSPVALAKRDPVEIQLDVPGRGPARIHAIVWHVRRVKSRGSRRRAWSAGMAVVDGDDLNALLVRSPSPEGPDLAEACESAREPGTYRVRVKLRGQPRSRLLTLAASGAAEAEELAIADLGEDWTVTEVVGFPPTPSD